MNWSAVTTEGHWNLLVLVTRCSQDWKIPNYPLALMFDLIRSAARLFLIGSAGAVLGVAGFILSILAYIKETIDSRRPRGLGADVASAYTSASVSPPRDRDLRARYSRKPQTRHDRSKWSSDRSRSPKSPRARLAGSGPRSTVTSPNSSQGPETPSSKESEQQGPNISRRRRSQGPTSEMKSVDDAIATHPVTPVLNEVTPGVTTALPPWRTQRTFSDVSSAQYSELSAGRLSSEERSPISGRRVLTKIKDRHTHLREHCLNRVHSIPNPKSSARPLRTDPYQAPYFFPSPMSPEAATYIQEVVNERHGTHLQPTLNSSPVEANALNPTPVPSSTRVNNESEEVARPALPSSRPPSPAPSLYKMELPHPTRRHRWSLHLPHLPHHHHVNDGARVADGHAQEKGGTAVHKEFFAKLKFGHHRRRHGIGSADSHAAVSFEPS
ncbi:hypothetical protein LXA43DRAFT_999170 [Ganoderma leucocontextum]|nr:hypothetical protein LXA43DRAFT_999170 [Ganoderma leucocontextum]